MIFFGRNVSKEALNSNHNLKSLFVESNIREDAKISEILSLAQKRQLKIFYKTQKELTAICNGQNEHQGVAIELDFNYKDLKFIQNNTWSEHDSFIYISDVTYEHNLGAIIRTAEVSGLKGVIIPKEAKVSPIVAKTSAGAVFHIPILRESIYNTIKIFKDKLNFDIASIERGGAIYYDANLKRNILFIIGGEDKSISQNIQNTSDITLHIPQFGKINSLNMSVAAAIVMYERVRQTLQQ